MGYYSPNPHYALDLPSDDSARVDEALAISGRWFREATKPQTARYVERCDVIRPYAGSPRWKREEAAAMQEFKDSTSAAATLCNEVYREVLATGEVSEALSNRWDELVKADATAAMEAA